MCRPQTVIGKCAKPVCKSSTVTGSIIGTHLKIDVFIVRLDDNSIIRGRFVRNSKSSCSDVVDQRPTDVSDLFDLCNRTDIQVHRNVRYVSIVFE